jgi:hypothetical protein
MQRRNTLMNQWNADAIRLATIKLGFGAMADGDDCAGQPEGTCRGGLGTVVGDRYTIYTSWHIYLNAQDGHPDWFYWRDRNGKLHSILLEPDMIEHVDGTDILIIHLPQALPEKDFVPAKKASPLLMGGEHVTVAYIDESHDLQTLETTVQWWPWGPWVPGMYGGWGTPVNNTNGTLNEGDSGGGVFYNGEFIGVNSYVGTDPFQGPFEVFELVEP